MTTLPIAHNGQAFDLVPVDHYASGRFRLVVSREVVFDAVLDEEGSWDYQEATVEESLGVIEVDARNDLVVATTRYNGGRLYVSDLTEAVAFLAERGRPCAHGDAREADSRGVWECDDCGALFAQAETGAPQVLRYAADARREETRLRF
jgi:hypothetical protein